MRNFCKQGTAWVLLITLLLQSCYNPYVGLGKKELIPQPASNKSITIQEADEYTESLSSLNLRTGGEVQSNELDRDNLASIQDMSPLFSEESSLPAIGTGPFQFKDSHQQDRPDHPIPGSIQPMDPMVIERVIERNYIQSPGTTLKYKNSYEQVALDQLKTQQKSSKELSLKRPASSAQKRLSKSPKRAKNKRFPSPTTQALEEEIKPADHLKPAIQLAKSYLKGYKKKQLSMGSQEIGQLLTKQLCIAKGGYEVRFEKKEGALQATVEEDLLVGFKRSQVLPVVIEVDLRFSPAAVRERAWQRNRIHVRKGYVYVGQLGLLGGGKDEKENPSQQEEVNVDELEEHDLGIPTDIIRAAQGKAQLLKNAEQGDPEAQFKLGVICEKEWKYTDAITWYGKAAEQEHTEALLNLGMMHQHGEGVTRDYAKARDLYEQAANKGNISAQYALGELYAKGEGVDQNYEQAIALFQEAAKKEHREAQFNLGKLYAMGEGRAQNYGEAMRWYKKAAKKEHREAQFNLGKLYAMGEGTAQNYREAITWYEKAADKGHRGAQCNLGMMYQHGEGVDANHTEAIVWYHKAARKGHIRAQANLAVLYENIKYEAKDYVEARAFFEEAANIKDDMAAQYILGDMYAKGEGVTQDYTKAIDRYKEAAHQGHAEAQYKLALIYQHGEGIDQDDTKAREWFAKAANKGHKEAKTKLEGYPKVAKPAKDGKGEGKAASMELKGVPAEKDPLQGYHYKDLQIPMRSDGGKDLPVAQKPRNIIGTRQEAYSIDGKSFKRQNVSGSGMRCFFNAAGLDAKEQINKLSEQGNNSVVRYMIANEIVSAAETPDQLSKKVKEAIGYTLYESQRMVANDLEEKRSLSLLKQSPDANEQNTKKLPTVFQHTSKRDDEIRVDLRKRASSLEAFTIFIEDHIGGENMMVALHDVQGDDPGENAYSNYTSIDAIAYVNNVGIKIYQPTKNGELRPAHQFIPTDATKVVYLYHSGVHFQALVQEEPGSLTIDVKNVREAPKEALPIVEKEEDASLVEISKEPSEDSKEPIEDSDDNASLPASPMAIHIPHITDLAADPARVKLGETILEITGAEPDERLNVYYKLGEALQDIFAQDKQLHGQWNHSWKQLEEPELLIDEDNYGDFQSKQRNSTELKELEAKFFAKYDKVYQELEGFKKILAEKFPDQYDWLFSLDRVAVFYNQFRQRVRTILPNSAEFHKLIKPLIQPKALLMGEWWPGRFYRVTQSQAHHLLNQDKSGEIIKKDKELTNTTSNHQVSFLPAGDTSKAAVYFKVNGMPALNPSREYMLYSLYKRLGIQVPASGLMILDHVKFKESYEPQPFILQASEAIAGLNGKKVLKENCPTQLNLEHFENQVIGALLTGPVDGKADNFILTPVGKEQGWVSIDNDEVFQAPTRKEGIHLKSMLFLLPEMRQQVSPATKTFLKCLHPSMLVLAWLVDLHTQTLSYEALKKTLGIHGENTTYPRKGGKLLAKQVEELWQDLSLPFTNLYHSTVLTVQRLLERLQALISTNKNQGHTLEDLFAHCYPYVHPYYKYLQEQALQEEQSAVDSQVYKALKLLYEGKKASLPVDRATTPEAAYFLVDKPLTIGTQISTYLKEQPNLDPDHVIKAYSSWLHQTPDPLQKFFICEQTLNSLQILQQYGLQGVQDIKTAIDLYAKVLSLVKKLNQEKAWEKVFDGFARANAELAWLLTLERNFPKDWEHAQAKPQHLKEMRGAFLGKRQLSAAMQKELFDQKGYFKADTRLSGRSSTNKYPENQPLFYFKKYPEIPGYEYAATAFMRHLGIKAAPRSELLTFYHPQEGAYPVLLTQAIAGKPVYQVWDHDKSFSKLDPYLTGLLIVASMLLNPEDSKEDNFILSADGKQLIPIDNDHSFLPGAVEVKGRLKVVPELQTKTLAFCLQEMYKPLPTTLVQQLTSMNTDLFLQQWLQELAKVSEHYQNILPEASLKTLWEKQGSCLRLPLSKAYIQGLYRKFHLLRTLLLQNPTITGLDLLKRLEPYVGKSYEEVAKLPTLKERFQAVSSIYKKKTAQGVRMSVASSQRLMEIMEVPSEEIQGNLIHCKLGPLGALEELQRLRQDKPVQDSRLKALLRGPIEPLKKLTQKDEELLIAQWFESKEPYDWIQLHDSQHLQEKHLTSFNFQNKGGLLTALDLRGAKNLGEKAFMTLHTYCPNLQYLNISAWSLLTRLGHFRKVSAGRPSIKLEFNEGPIFSGLQRLIVENCILLQEMNIHLPGLESLEAGGNNNLKRFSITAPTLRRLDITGHQINPAAFKLSTHSITRLTLQGVALHAEAIEKALEVQTNAKLDLSNKGLNALDIALLVNHPLFKKNKVIYEEIDLSSNQISDQGAAELIKHLQGTSVRTLNLCINQIGDAGAQELADALPKSHVHTLDLGWNQIDAAGAQELAKALPKSQIHTLNLYNNEIGDAGAKELAKALPKSQIHTLDLGRNYIGVAAAQELAKALPKSQIHTLDLRYNYIGHEGAKELAKALPKSQIHTLDLRDNYIGDEGAKELAKALPNSHIYTLYLGSNGIGDAGAQELADALPKSQIHTLDLGSNKIGDAAAQELAKALPNSHIHTLKLELNQIGDAGAQELADALPKSQIHTLNLGDNQIGNTGAQKLADALPKSQIHTLDLSSNQVGDAGARELAKSLPKSQIHTLDLGKNSIGAAAAQELADALPNSHIHVLYLGWNFIGAAGAEELAKALPKSQIHTLDLGNNRIGDTGAQELAEALPNSHIHTLNLGHNQIGTTAAQELAKALPNSQIRTLNLEYNQIGDAGVKALADALPNSHIYTLDLGDNQIGAAGAQGLAKALPKSQIHSLNLSWNKIGAVAAQELAAALPKSQIHTLNLGNNQIGAAAAQELAKALPNSYIYTLDLSGNQIGDLGAQELADALPNSHIHTLDLKSNSIGARGAGYLAETLSKSQIHTLNLASNYIGAAGAQELAKALPNSQIHTLDLSFNQIGAAAAQELAKALPNSHIHTLYLKDNRIGAAGARELAKALPNSHIHTLDLNNNQIGDAAAQELAKALPNSHIRRLHLEKNQIGDHTQELLRQEHPNIDWRF